jgi:acyl-coenzyme A synthetase/AMP-(fatty) acid ligase
MTFGIPDPMPGKDIAAMVVPADTQITEPDHRNYLPDRLIQSRVPRKIWFTDEILKNTGRKSQRHIGTRRFS